MRVAYLVSRYPGISHIFIEREVLGLRALGLDVETFSVRPCPPDQLRTDTMRAEAARTTSILDGSPTRLSMLLLKVAVRHWMPVLRAARITAMIGEQVLRSRLWQMFYLAEAMALMEHCRARGIKHIHVHFANNGADIARLAVILGEHIEGKDAGWRWSFTMHGSNEFEAVDRFDLAAKVRSASGVVCVSDFTRSQLMRLVDSEHWAKLTKVHMTVDEDVYQPPADRRRDRAGPFRILMVGRLVPEKAPLILVEAVDQLVRRGVCVDLRFVGSGMLEAQSRRQGTRSRSARHVARCPRSAPDPSLVPLGRRLLPPKFPGGPSRSTHGSDGHGAARRDDPYCRNMRARPGRHFRRGRLGREGRSHC